MSWQQKTIQLKPRSRGFHIIDDELLRQLPEITQYKVGLLHLFIQHTSASLTVQENADIKQFYAGLDVTIDNQEKIVNVECNYMDTPENTSAFLKYKKKELVRNLLEKAKRRQAFAPQKWLTRDISFRDPA